MKLGTRPAAALLTVTIVLMLLFHPLVLALSNYQTKSLTKGYELTERVDLLLGNSMQIFNHITKRSQEGIRNISDNDLGLYNDLLYLDKVNTELRSYHAYLTVRKGNTILYCGDSNKDAGETICTQLPQSDMVKGDLQGGTYLGDESQHLIKRMDFTLSDGQEGSVSIISNVDGLIPEVKSMIREIPIPGITILVFAGVVLTFRVYRSILSPLNKFQEATKKIRDRNLDFTLDVDADDEVGQLCQDFGEIRIRLKGNAEGKTQYDEDNKELTNNISHGLKTPIMTIKGYVEGIPDGMVLSSGKLDKYVRATYNKSSDMDRLTDELTFYSKIDTNRIPYTFSKINMTQCFWSCMKEVGLDMRARGIGLGHFSCVNEDVVIIADAEQMRRVMNSIINNSVKYLDKKKGIVNTRTKDVGDFTRAKIEDNGRGTAAKDLPNIPDRFYRTDSSRNSAQGGSDIGLSIVRKIVEDHGGRI